MFGCQIAKTAPWGSAITAIRPASSTSIGAMKTVPPACVAAAHVASASATVMYVVHIGGGPPSRHGPSPATVRPRMLNIRYPPVSSTVPGSVASQPNSAP